MSDATFYRRFALGGLIIIWMQWGPVAHQLLGQRMRPGMMTWRMFYVAAIDVCDVRYTAVDLEGERTPIDRFAALGYDHSWEPRRSVRRINDRKHIERQGKELCETFLPHGHFLEAEARCASVHGWKPEVFDGPICDGAMPAPASRERPRRSKGKRRGDR